MKYEIVSSVFWKNLSSEYNYGQNWHLADKKIQKITKNKLGLKYVDTVFSSENITPYTSIFIFEVVDQEKLIWARLKYGI